ncbi:MAG TPA: glycosyltransferase, partial [Anaerolineaceae bacterium]|nr:glycosyltransferase [Anaerolineaceae bacterium]
MSVIVPCYNEQATIRLLLDAIYCQTFPRERMDVVIADGMSTDQTRWVIGNYCSTHPDLKVQVVDNPKRSIPSGLNRALEASTGDIIVRLDAHSVPQADYIARCVTALEKNLGETVGGVWDIHPGGKGWMARSIAAVAAHPLGVGDARYRYTTQAGQVDTVPFGAYRRSTVQRIGAYDE